VIPRMADKRRREVSNKGNSNGIQPRQSNFRYLADTPLIFILKQEIDLFGGFQNIGSKMKCGNSTVESEIL
jgi:hypothetical protein